MKLYPWIAVLGMVSLSSISHAGFLPAQWDGNDEGVFQLSFEGQYFYQSNNLALVTEKLFTFNPTILHAPNAEKEWGYRATLGYIFPAQNYDVRASYWDVRSNRNLNTTELASILTFVTQEKSNYDFKAAEMTFGQYFNPSCCLAFRVGYGIAYADINQKAKAAVTALQSDVIVGGGQDSFENSFKGIGPKLSLDSIFNVNNSFSLVSTFGISLLFGEAQSVYTLNPANYPEGGSRIKQQDNKAVFEADGKLGASFSQALNDDFAFNLEAGYRAAYYFNALQASGEQIQFGEALIVVNDTNDDYYNYGPYINVTLNFM